VARVIDARALDLGETIDSLVARTWRARPGEGDRAAALRRVAARAVTDRLLGLAADRDAAPEARAMAELKLAALAPRARLAAGSGSDAARAHWLAVAGDVTRWLERRELPTPTAPLRAPPGDPFGIEP
jgi:hypothetical protein